MIEVQAIPALRITASAVFMPLTLHSGFKLSSGRTSITAACEVVSISVADVLGPRGNKEICRKRKAVMYAVSEHCRHLSFPQLGAVFRRDPSTIYHATSTAPALIESDPTFADMVNRILARLSFHA